MNERFNDLRLEAGISRLHEVPYMVAVNKEGEIIEPSDGLQKFAELIVRDCVRVCNKVYFDNYPDAEDFERSEEGEAIKQHFGVKV